MTSISFDNEDYPIRISYDEEGISDGFTEDGKNYKFHKEPSLKLIERPKKKVKKTIERWVNVYPDGSTRIFKSVLTADKVSNLKRRIACVKLTGEYEVDSDE